MWLLVDEFNSQYWWNYPHFFDIGAVIVRTGSSSSNYFGIFQLGWALTLLFLFSTLNGVTCVCDYSWMIQLAVLVELSFLWDIGAVIVRTGSSSSNYFWYLSLGWAPLFLSARSMGCNVHVTTHGWIQLAVLVELSLLWHIGAVIVRTGSSSSNYFGISQLGWALTLLFLFSTLNGL
jgi:hypothetical protein